jgi:hypothetical protein
VRKIIITGIKNDLTFGPESSYDVVLITGILNTVTGCRSMESVEQIGIDNIIQVVPSENFDVASSSNGTEI